MKNPLFKYSNLPGCNYLIFLILLLCFSLPILAKGQSDTTSFLQTVDIKTGKIDTLLIMKNVFEAPNWHPDNFLVINSGGELYKFELDTKKLTVINTDFANLCNNDHGISADGKWLAISHNDTKDPSTKPYKSAIYKVPITGGKPIKITTEVPSFWHGWNPTGKDIVYCAERNGNYDIYRIGVNGGTEKRLTTSKGLDDGPEYSPDGKYIYFNSYRSGHMQIWRMLEDGTLPEQLTFDGNSNWFAHPSPDNNFVVYIAYISNQKDQHLFGKDVKLRLMDPVTKVLKDITPVFYGGQGTINVPSWSPDSQKIAFVSYSVE